MDREQDPLEQYFNSDERKPKKRRGNVFATVVSIIVIALLVLLVIALFKPEILGEQKAQASEPPDIFAYFPTPSPAPKIRQDLEVKPVETPAVTEDDRVMPALDGIPPELPGVVENPIPDIFEVSAPGVVSVLNYVSFPGMHGSELAVYGSGTGFFVSTTGYILTNAHVVDGAAKITVKLDGEDDEIDAKLIGADTETDIAVLKIERENTHALPLGDSDEVRVGEYVLAIGNPINAEKFANTLTFGIISAKSREVTIDSYTNTYLQTDAAINVGNSGGPLLNIRGEVIGMNSAKTVYAGYDAYGNAMSAESIGFALPINEVVSVMELLVRDGQIRRPGLGIVVTYFTEELAELNGLPSGIYVTDVVKGGPADLAGVLAEDIITEADGKTFEDQSGFVNYVKSKHIGETILLRVCRAGEYLDIEVKLENKSEMDFSGTSIDN